jgi:hypothetical protein
MHLWSAFIAVASILLKWKRRTALPFFCSADADQIQSGVGEKEGSPSTRDKGLPMTC